MARLFKSWLINKNLYLLKVLLGIISLELNNAAAPDPEVCKIIDHLFLGSQDAAVNRKDLDANNIKFILNVSTGIPNAYPEVGKPLLSCD